MDKIYIKYIQNEWKLTIFPHIGLYNGWEGAREGAGGGAKLVQFGRKFDQFGPFLGP